MSTFAAIAVLAVLILVHELGHFTAARAQGIHVNRFSIGFGPILWKYQGPETEYALRGIPLGGFVGFPDDDPDSKIPANDPDLLRNRPVLDRAIVISAGVIANLVFAYLLFVVQVGTVGMPELQFQPGVLVPEVAPQVSAAAVRAGIQPKDIILGANGQELGASNQARTTLMKVIQDNPAKPVQLDVQRGNQKLSLQVMPELGADGQARIGVQLLPNGKMVRHRTSNIGEIFSAAASEFQRFVLLTLQGFGQLISNFRETASQISGPVAIVAFGAKSVESDAANLLQFAALISINLAVINIMPLPALDGGQLAFLFIEGLRGKPLPTKIQDGVMQTGLMVFLGLGVFLIVRDTANLEWVQRLFQ